MLRVVEVAFPAQGHRLARDVDGTGERQRARSSPAPSSPRRSSRRRSGVRLRRRPSSTCRRRRRRRRAAARARSKERRAHQYDRSFGSHFVIVTGFQSSAGPPSTQRTSVCLRKFVVVALRIVVRARVRAAALLAREPRHDHALGELEQEAELERLREIAVEDLALVLDVDVAVALAQAGDDLALPAASAPRAGRRRSSRASSSRARRGSSTAARRTCGRGARPADARRRARPTPGTSTVVCESAHSAAWRPARLPNVIVSISALPPRRFAP